MRDYRRRIICYASKLCRMILQRVLSARAHTRGTIMIYRFESSLTLQLCTLPIFILYHTYVHGTREFVGGVPLIR